MTVIATVSVPAADFDLGRALGDLPASMIELEQLVPLGDAPVPYFWADNDDREAVVATLSDSSLVDDVHVVDELDGRSLVRIEWTDEVDGLLENISATDGALVDATGTTEEWTFQLRFVGYSQLSAFFRACVEDDIAVEVNRVHNPIEGERGRFGLTPLQQETLLAALETGYFAVPRETSLADLGEHLGVSDAAVSERLRRGQATLVAATLLAGAAASPNRNGG